MKNKCLHVDGGNCTHVELGGGIVIEHPLKEKWDCHTCDYFTSK